MTNQKIYCFDPSNSSFTNVFSFSPLNGVNPYGGLVQASNGLLYGMTMYGGVNSAGVLFSLDPANNNFVKLYDFATATGSAPMASLTQAADGLLYGTTSAGGDSAAGVIFSFDLSNNVYTKLFSFGNINGINAQSDLADAGNGTLFGTTYGGGAFGYGTIFRFDVTTHVFTKLVDFDGVNGSGSNSSFTGVDVTGIAPRPGANPFTLYPNPTDDQLTIAGVKASEGTTSFVIRNVLGQEFMSWEEQDIDNNYRKMIDARALPAGVYLLETSNSGKMSVVRFVVK